ncbi:hypothetical protein V2J09_001960 [Rumex salicifolius]
MALPFTTFAVLFEGVSDAKDTFLGLLLGGGTFGYIAPEIFSQPKASPASDVFSFGMVLLQIVTGRKEFDVQEHEGKLLLVSWVWMLDDEGRVLDAVDRRLVTMRSQSYRYSSEEAKRLRALGAANGTPPNGPPWKTSN